MQEAAASAMESMLRRAEAQTVLFAPKLSRLALQKLALDDAAQQHMRINVWRNHAIEGLLTLAQQYFAFGQIGASFRLSDYDDSLMFTEHQASDVELLWLDSERYLARTTASEWIDWLEARLRALRALSHAPCIVATWMASTHGDRKALQSLAESMPGVYFADLAAFCDEAGVVLTEQRSAAVAGTPISNAAQPLLARKLASHWLPGAALAPVKAIALDLDETLHVGILGEDGVDSVQLTAAHSALQRMLHAQSQRGIFLALVSRNQRADAEALFARREDYPLRWNDFAAIEVSWDAKAQALARIAASLRIAPDAMLFVDDNPGELASVAAALAGIKTVHAAADASVTQRAIEYYPGLWRWRVEAEDSVRVRDLKANVERVALRSEASDSGAYFRSLQVELALRFDPIDQLGRTADLCRKTNQFNLALQRFSEADIAARMTLSTACVATLHMKDRLSDSGVIGVVVAQREDTRLHIDEICLSCRALGRQLEDTMIFSAIAGMPQFADCTEIVFAARHGPRNQPALEWLGRLLGLQSLPAEGVHTISAAAVQRFEPDHNLKITHETVTR